MRRYVVAYIDVQGRTEHRRSKTIEAENAKDARKLFEQWYYREVVAKRSGGVIGEGGYAYRITVKRFDGLLRCPLCGSWLDEPDDREVGYVCPNVPHCGLIIKRKPQSFRPDPPREGRETETPDAPTPAREHGQKGKTMNENIIIQAEAILSTTRAECLRGMDTGNMDARLAWYYTHCGEIEMASYLGAITNERMNALESEWKEHKPIADSANRQRDSEWTEQDARIWYMTGIADNAMKLLKMARPEKNLGISYIKVSGDNIESFSEWQRERNAIRTGDEYFLVWDYSPDWETDEPDLLYAVCVTGDSLLTAAAELMNLLSRKF